jgi:hypothetical protein
MIDGNEFSCWALEVGKLQGTIFSFALLFAFVSEDHHLELHFLSWMGF